MVKIQILDVSYYTNFRTKEPIIQIFGKDSEGKSQVINVSGFRPYFYALPMHIGREDEEGIIIEDEYPQLSINIVSRYLPMGYQEGPRKVYVINYTNPQDTRDFRERLVTDGYVKEVYEADILFKNRFMVDLGIKGFDWIEVPGERCTYQEIKVLKDESILPFRVMGLDIETEIPETGGFPTADKCSIIIATLAFEPLFEGRASMVLAVHKMSATDVLDGMPGQVPPYLRLFEREDQLLDYLEQIVHDYDPDIIVDYNGNEFDMGYITDRLNIVSLKNDMGRNGRSWFCRESPDKTTWQIPGRIHLDLLPLIKKHVNPTEFKSLKHPLKEYSLKYVASQLLEVQKLDMKPSEMRRVWESDEWPRMIEYARRDAELMPLLLNKVQLLDKYIALAQAAGCLLQDVLNGGQSTMIDMLMIREFKKYDRLIPMRPSFGQQKEHENQLKEIQKTLDGLDLEEYSDSDGVQYQGGLVLPPEVGLWEWIVIMDFASLYPSIMRAFNLSPDTIYYENGKAKFRMDFQGIVPKILERLYESRVAYKKEMKTTTDMQLKAQLNLKQYGCKILLNSIYGYFGFDKSRLFEMSIAAKVTEEGRNALILTKKTVESHKGLKVIAGDTDSVFIHVGNGEMNHRMFDINRFVYATRIGKTIHDEMAELLPKPMSLAFEAYGKRGILLAKKRYAIAITEDGDKYTIKQRGIETRRRDWCNYVEETLSTVFDTLLNEGDITKAGIYAKTQIERIAKLQYVTDDPDLLAKLVLSKKYSKPVDQYKVKTMHMEALKRAQARGDESIHLGDRIMFYVVDKHVKQSTAKTEVVDYVIEQNLPIDKDYYINKQLAPPLERIFKVLNFNIATGRFNGKQVTFEGF